MDLFIKMQKTIYTIGHSTRSLNDFLMLLNQFAIKCLIDIRSFPGSKRYPHFNKEFLGGFLQSKDIAYVHMRELGGRRKPKADSKNTAWRNASFKGYADYMGEKEFKDGIDNLQQIAEMQRTAYMCSEAVWWRCHRSLVSDYLKVKAWEVLHILDDKKVQSHPFSSPANVVQGELFYS